VPPKQITVRNPIWRTSRMGIEVLEGENEQKAWPTKSQAGREPAQSMRARDKPRTQRLETTDGGKISRAVCSREAGPNHRVGRYCGNPDARRTDRSALASRVFRSDIEKPRQKWESWVCNQIETNRHAKNTERGGIKHREGAGWPARSQGTRWNQSCTLEQI
jgi:hypothetical protein